MNQGQRGGIQYGACEEYQQGGPPGRGVQDVPHRPKEAWGDRRDARNNQPWDISMCDYTEMHTYIILIMLLHSSRLSNYSLCHRCCYSRTGSSHKGL